MLSSSSIVTVVAVSVVVRNDSCLQTLTGADTDCTMPLPACQDCNDPMFYKCMYSMVMFKDNPDMSMVLNLMHTM